MPEAIQPPLTAAAPVPVPGAPPIVAEPPAPEISVLVPVLNEEGTIEELTGRLVATLEAAGRSFEIVYIDDGSNDRTVAEIRRMHAADKRVSLVRFRRNFGKAAAITAGVEHSRGEILITIDGDLQDIPEEIPRFLDKLEQEDLDLVSGWKQDRQDPAGKRLPSLLFNWVTGKLAQVPLHDFNCGFKAYRREVLDQVSIYGELHRYIPVLASRRGFKVGELSVSHAKRKSGVSKYGWDRFYKGLLDLITVLFITKYTRRPLHLFGAFGLAAIGLGFAINIYLAALWFMNQPLSNRPLLQLGILLTVLGFQILTTGLIGEMITFKSFRREDSYSIRELLK
jgi:glycosyltransferase involved in cell wall biosynthesis